MKPLAHSKSYRTKSVGALSHTLGGARKRIVVHQIGTSSSYILRAPAFVAVPRPCPRSVVYRGSAGMQADEKPWLQYGIAPHQAYFVDRIQKVSSGPAGPGMKFDGDSRVHNDSSGVVRGDLRAMYEECARECARWNLKPGVHTVALAVLQSDDHCAAIFGTDAKGTRAFHV